LAQSIKVVDLIVADRKSAIPKKRNFFQTSSILQTGGSHMSDVIHALETAAAILLGVIVLTGIISAVAVKRGDAALSKHHH
jgi:hypothetical protein